ncbi:MAG TPA: peptidylprolyl isomerase [Puia sp.]|jgi:peptidyl-prolyl cis-trans isomerase D
MSIIQVIREKAAWLVFGLIALSLVGFLLMDAFVGRSKLFGNRSTVVGTINGEKIEYNDFQKQVSDQEDRYKQQGYPVNEGMQQNIRESVWKQMIEDAIVTDDVTTLGLDVSDKEVNDMLVGPNAIPDIKQAFTDPKTGQFDAQAAANQINQLRNIYKSGAKKADKNFEGARRFFEESVPQIIRMRLREKYTALLANSSYVPKWMIEKMNADNTQLAAISYVNTPYFSIPDSSVKVSDGEIEDYVNQHKEQYKQEESRSIAYVTFDAAPSSGDSAKLRQLLTDLTKEFAASANPEAFLARVGTEQPYFDGYIGKSRIQVPNKDSIFALAKGATFGPYQDAGNYTVAKLIDVKTLPDSVRARHILVATVDPRSGQPLMDDSTGKKKIDSIKNLIEHGARFDSIAAKLSDDPGSKEKGGDLGYFTADKMVKEFADFCFNGKTGEKKIVKSQFGYHYIEILDQKSFEPAYKVAYLSRKIETSAETDQAASGMASQFAGESRDAKSFDDNVQKDHLQKLLAPDIQPAEFAIPGLGPNRQLVRWIYDAELGNVSEPFTVGDKYVVATLTEINKAGTMTAAKARNLVEPILRNRKKADLIMKKLGTPASLDAASASSGQPIMHADSILFSSPFIPNTGQEAKVVGSAFNKSLAGKPASPPIPGNGGVFVIKVENVSAISNPNADLQQQRFMQEQQQRSRISYGLVDALRKQATIKDDRGKFF